MRVLEEIAEVPLSLSPVSSNFPTTGGDYNPRVSYWLFECHGLWYNIALIVPSVLFVVYSALHARKSFTKLSHGRSYVKIAYYGVFWLVSTLNLAWCALQAWECTPGKELSWNLLSFFTASGMLFLEVSLVAFLLKGNCASGLEALTDTFEVSGIIVGVDMLFKAIFLFGFGVPLFMDGDDTTNGVKFGFWVSYKLFLAVVYGSILLVHHTKLRERLPARPAFFNYLFVMFCLNAIAVFACGLVGIGSGSGFWLFNLTTFCYHTFYLPLTYVTYLGDFFQEEDLNLENVYYSEMKDAGFFDADWD